MAKDVIKNMPYNLFVVVPDFDLPTVYGVVEFIQWDGQTLNSPYAAGRTTSRIGLCFSYQTTDGYASQLAFAVGNNKLFFRLRSPQGWKQWSELQFTSPS